MRVDIDDLRRMVQRNCDISDAQHAQDYTMCIYLLKMREYFRWESGYPLDASLPKDELGAWVVERESRWESLAQEDYRDLDINGVQPQPFDVDAVNRHLLPQEHVYSAGLGRFVKPHFFLGELYHQSTRDGYEVLVADRELARDISGPPAMLRGRTILVRRDTLKRLLWERVEEWRWHRQADHPMARCMACYPFDDDDLAALELMTENELEAAILHELGEARAGDLLGEPWHELLAEVAHSRIEVQARAVRDLIADCDTTLPALFEQGRDESVHFYFANFQTMRKALCPSLLDGYRHWVRSGDGAPLLAAAARGAEHWREVAQNLLQMPNATREQRTAVIQYVESRVL